MKRLIPAVVVGLLLATGAPADNNIGFIQNLGWSQISCGTTATLVVAPRSRNAITIKDPTGAGQTVYIGGSTVTTSGTTGGLSIDAGTAMTLQPFNGSVYCVAGSAQTISYLESY